MSHFWDDSGELPAAVDKCNRDSERPIQVNINWTDPELYTSGFERGANLLNPQTSVHWKKKPSCRTIDRLQFILANSGAASQRAAATRLQSHPNENRSAAQTCSMRRLFKLVTRLPRRSCEIVTAFCKFTAHRLFIPSSTSSTNSEGTSRTVEVIGATVAVDRWPTAHRGSV
jgi:hypothetical protein